MEFKNFFADRIPTKGSLNSLLALDIHYYDELKEKNWATADRFFSGGTKSPLFEVFKNNGYETSTYYENKAFGSSKGPFIDNYYSATQHDDEILGSLGKTCDFIKAEGVRTPTFLGYCYIMQSDWVRKKMGILGVTLEDQMDALIGHMRYGLMTLNPQVFVAYIYSPGHTSNFYRGTEQELNNYRKQYSDNSKTTASYLLKLINFINYEDPTAIVYVFGDHGMFTSRGIAIAKNSEFVVQDRFGVFGGIFPKDSCKSTFSDTVHTEKDFMTVSQVAHSIISCLSKYEISLSPNDYTLPDIPPGISKRYEDYIYE